MYKNKEFEYDLWTTEDGHYYARVKSTGEVSEISREIFRFLRCQEKEVYRRQELRKANDENKTTDESVKRKATVENPLSLDPMDENVDESAWGYTELDFTDIVCLSMLLTEFEQTLSEKQLEVYTCIFKNHETRTAFAARKGVSDRSVRYVLEKIQEKAKLFFNEDFRF